ncbi:hypothetical protein AGABI2DRAFT_196990 [Agaricus bisporus var. bisporus H97]|uniref:hypothetical protein n=1 Tax=Agaricus bisporus var. bisporus (strain H97 / ATCC MYA-4626 / FGSC 10389) TaxID=936046 RepID=UPI00029F5CE8|nr:hypothetical protein AGABI2DRAFT_196990 [Agaricus bisporus var. bisporus H97]EKV51180.1 hypothetical protein AGABI2DRAFT_196990 [Agaricus bisporus var. bisporus H97]
MKGIPSVKEQGLELWLTVKDAKSKDGRLLSLVFLTKPPKKVYPDYYQIIKSPIALDDIKKRLDTDAYPSMQAVRADFELLFNNALQYNMKDSVIWKDAKEMLRLVHKTYEKFVPATVPTTEGDDFSDNDEKKGKSKAPNLSRLIKSRLQKLVEKTDKDGRLLSTEFMELPNKKLWAIYYKQIKKPQCLENIFRRIKRKEYHTATTFAADVELVFSNAMSFNQDHTPIWEDALTLRDYFRQLMSDLPPPHNLSEYSSSGKITNKIKIKPPVAQANAPSEAVTSKADNATSTLRLRVPAASTVKTHKPVATPPVTEAKLPSTTAPVPSATASTTSTVANPPVPLQTRPPAQPVVVSTAQSSTRTTQPGPASQPSTFSYSHYSHPYQPPSQPTPGPSSAPVVPAKVVPALSDSPAPAPINPSHQIKYIKLRIQPLGRLFWLDYREGVKTWVLRLTSGESEIDVDDLVFLADEEEEGSSDEEEEDLEENDMDIDGPTAKNGRPRKGRTSTRRSQKNTPINMRTTRSAAAVAKSKVIEQKKEDKIEEVQLKLNGTVMEEKQEAARKWNINVSAGSNTLEVGEKGGLMWKVYIERTAD